MPLDVDATAVTGTWWRHIPHDGDVWHRPRLIREFWFSGLGDLPINLQALGSVITGKTARV